MRRPVLPLRSRWSCLAWLTAIFASFFCPVASLSADGAAWGRPVLEVRLESDARMNIADFKAQITQEKGQPLDESKVSQSLKNLYATGLFRDLQAELQEEKTGVILSFVAHATYFVGLVQVSGVPKGLQGNLLVSASRLRLGQPLTAEDVAAAEKRLKDVLAQNGFYLAQVKAQVQKVDHQEADILFSIVPGRAALLSGVDFQGHTLMPLASLGRMAGWRVGIHLTSSRLERGLSRIRRFYVKRGRLEASAAVEKRLPDLAHNTEKLVVGIEAGPIVQIAVQGASIRSYQLRRLIPVFNEGQTDDLSLAQGQRNLQDYFERQGYFSDSIAWKRETSADGQRLKITYAIQLGARGRFVGMAFTGNRHVSEDDLDSAVQLQPEDFSHARGIFSRELLSSDVKAVADVYQSKGFLDVKVTPSVNNRYQNEPNQLFVTFAIEEGPQTTVNSLVLQGVDEAIQASIRSFLLTNPGRPYSPQRAKTDQDAILTYLANHGQNHADATWKALPASPDHRVDLEYDIRPGMQERVQRIIVMGNQHTRAGVIDRQLAMRVGEPLREREMLESQRRLYDLGVFNQVQIAHQDPEIEGPQRTVLVSVEEARRWTVAYGGGIDVQRLESENAQGQYKSSQYKASPRVALQVTRLNVGGRPQTFSIRGRYSNLEKEGASSYLIPHFLNRDNLNFRVTALADQTRDLATFNVRREEASVILERHSSPSTYILARYTYRRVAVSALHINPADVPLLSQPARVAMLEGIYVNDHRDNPIDAARGSYSVLDLGVASQKLGSESNFLRMSGQNSTYYQIRPNLIFARDTRLGVESTFGGFTRVELPDKQVVLTHEIPLPERFFMGGSESHRGFSINQAGPRDLVTGLPVGGNALFLNSLELRFRFEADKYGVVLFHDAGNVYSTIRRMRLLKFTQSSPTDFDYTVQAAGIGFRYQTPIGPLRFDVGFPLNPPRFQVQPSSGPPEVHRLPRVQFLLSVGQSF